MARLFPGSGSDHLAATITAYDSGPWTAFAWIRQDGGGGGGNSRIFHVGTGTSGQIFYTSGDSTNSLEQQFATSQMLAGAGGGNIGQGWRFLAFGYDGSTATPDDDGGTSHDEIATYLGSVSSAMAQIDGGVTTAGSGSRITGLVDLTIGNRISGSFPRCWNGALFCVGMVPYIMTLADAELLRQGNLWPLTQNADPIFFFGLEGSDLNSYTAIGPSLTLTATGTTTETDPVTLFIEEPSEPAPSNSPYVVPGSMTEVTGSTVTKPSGGVVGDAYLILSYSEPGTVPDSGAISGFTLLETVGYAQASNEGFQLKVFYRWHDGTEGSSFVYSAGSSALSCCLIRDADPNVAPIVGTESHTGDADTTPSDVTGLVTTLGNSLALICWGQYNNSGSNINATGWTFEFEHSLNQANALLSKVVPLSGAVGTVSVDFGSGTTSNGGVMIAFTPRSAIHVLHAGGVSGHGAVYTVTSDSWDSTADSIIIVHVVVWQKSADFTDAEMTDNKGNVYTRVPSGSIHNASGESSAVYYNVGGARGAGHTVTFASAASSGDFINIGVLEADGVDPDDPVDSTTTATATDASSPFDVTAAGPVTGDQLAVVGYVFDGGANNAWGVPSGYTDFWNEPDGSTYTVSLSAYKVAETGTPTVSATSATSVGVNANEIFVTFRATRSPLHADNFEAGNNHWSDRSNADVAYDQTGKMNSVSCLSAEMTAGSGDMDVAYNAGGVGWLVEPDTTYTISALFMADSGTPRDIAWVIGERTAGLVFVQDTGGSFVTVGTTPTLVSFTFTTSATTGEIRPYFRVQTPANGQIFYMDDVMAVLGTSTLFVERRFGDLTRWDLVNDESTLGGHLGTGSFTTDSFTPPADSMLVVFVSYETWATGTTPDVTLTDSQSHEWTEEMLSLGVGTPWGISIVIYSARNVGAASMTLTAIANPVTDMATYKVMCVAFTGENPKVGQVASGTADPTGTPTLVFDDPPSTTSMVLAANAEDEDGDATTVVPEFDMIYRSGVTPVLCLQTDPASDTQTYHWTITGSDHNVWAGIEILSTVLFTTLVRTHQTP